MERLQKFQQILLATATEAHIEILGITEEIEREFESQDEGSILEVSYKEYKKCFAIDKEKL